MTAGGVRGDKCAVLVLGPPRSGTSAVSHILNRLGVDFGAPAAFVDSGIHTHNPIFFELKKLNELNDLILASLGIQYAVFDYLHDPSVVEPALVERFTPQIRALVDDELSGGRLIGLKDPRFVFTLAVWTAALGSFGYTTKLLLTSRSTEAVAKSNAVVNGFSERHNRRIAVLSAQLAALQLRGKDFMTVDYDGLVERPVAEAERIAAWLGVDTDVAGAAAEVIAHDLRHHIPSDQSPAKAFGSRDDLEAQAQAFEHWRASLDSIGLVELLDERRQSVGDLQKALLAANEQKWLEGNRFNAEIEQLRKRVHELEQELLSANTSKSEEASAWIARERQLHQSLEEAVRSAVEQMRRADGADQKLIALQEKLSAAEARLHEAGLELRRSMESAVEQLHRADAADRRYVALDATLAQARDELVAVTRERDDLVIRLSDSDARHMAAEQSAAVARAESVTLKSERDSITLERDELASRAGRLLLRVRGLERRQRWAVVAGTVAAAVAAAAYRLWG